MISLHERKCLSMSRKIYCYVMFLESSKLESAKEGYLLVKEYAE